MSSTPRRWFYPLLVLTVAGLIGVFYVLTPQPADPAAPVAEQSLPIPQKKPSAELNIPLSESPDQTATASKKTKPAKAKVPEGDVSVAATELEELGENAENLEKFTTLEESGLEKLTIDGMYVGEFTYLEQRCQLEADLRISYVKSSGKPPRGRWEYLVTCNDQIRVSGSGIEALESHMRLAGSGRWLLTNPSRPMNILEFSLGTPNEIDFTVYEMRDGKYHRAGSGLAYNTESR